MKRKMYELIDPVEFNSVVELIGVCLCFLEYTVRTQLRQIISDKDTQYLPNIHPNEGRALEEEAVRLMFRLCEKFNVGNLVKYHSLHIYDR